MSSNICAHAIETTSHNYRIYHKNRICMHAPAHVHGSSGWARFLCHLYKLFMLFMWIIYAICAEKQNHNLWYASHAGVRMLDQRFDWHTWEGLTRYTGVGYGWAVKYGPTRSHGWSARTFSTIWKPHIYRVRLLWALGFHSIQEAPTSQSCTTTAWPSAHPRMRPFLACAQFVSNCMREKLESVSVNYCMHGNKKFWFECFISYINIGFQ
jgi:hypothetical protein